MTLLSFMLPCLDKDRNRHINYEKSAADIYLECQCAVTPRAILAALTACAYGAEAKPLGEELLDISN